MKINRCYACGKGTPELVMTDAGYKFICVGCGCETKQKDSIEELKKDWNEGVIYTTEKFWRKAFGKEGSDNG